jgi:hypothetical protein
LIPRPSHGNVEPNSVSATDPDATTTDRAVARGRVTTFRPRLLEPTDAGAMRDLASLRSSNEVLFVHDEIQAQLEELVETRAPASRLSRSEVATRVGDLTGVHGSNYGTWVFYPWSGRLVHVLPQSQFEELRTSRNRNKITREEQNRLARLRIGIVGLSVGQSTAVTLALEGVGGVFRLADFDVLSLSNMNRLRAGVHEIGVNKAVLAARAIFEINPYARVEVFDRGIHDDTIGAFLSDEEPLDILIEECDDMKIKFRLRLEARKRGIPVLMETSDRGMLDVERFDLEPGRPLFHGLVGDLDLGRLAGMTTYERVPIGLAIVGAHTMSARLAASLVDVDTTLKTWPQLASSVALGGAINTDVARRIALGQFNRSGRFFLDPEGVVSDEAVVEAGVDKPESAAASAADARPSMDEPPLRLGDDEPVSAPALERLVRLAALAPSGGNCQPWRFTYGGGTLRFWHDEARSRSFLDFEHRATYVAFGAAAENLRITAGAMGLGLALRPFPDPSDLALVCEARLGGEAERLTREDAALAACVEQRCTNRRVEKRIPLPAAAVSELESVAERAGARLHMVVDPDRLAGLGEVLGQGDRLRFLSDVMRSEMMGEVRWSESEAAATRDGLDIASLELTPTDQAAMRLLTQDRVVHAMRETGGGDGLANASRKSVAAASAIGLLTVKAAGIDPASRALSLFRGGCALQRVWLTSTRLALSFQPMTALCYLFARLEEGGGQGLDAAEIRRLTELRVRYRELLGLDRPATEVLLFRVTVSSPPTARSLRRRLSEVLVVES